MLIGSLFSGIGGLELGLEAAGWGPVVWQVEADAWCRDVLARRWPNVDRSVTDVRATGSILPRVDLICGGFPCQDVSGAGKGAGLAGARSGLWYEFARIIGELRPKFVVIENVRSGAKRWVDPVCGQLSDLGYRVRALGIGARDVGAPHRRARVFVVGILGDADGQRWAERSDGTAPRDIQPAAKGSGGGAEWPTPTASPSGSNQGGAGGRIGPVRLSLEYAVRDWPTVTVADARGSGGRQDDRGNVCHSLTDRVEQEGGSRVLSPAWVEALMGFPSGWVTSPDWVDHALPERWPAGRGVAQYDWEPARTVPARTLPNRVAMIRGLGNAVVPACARVVGEVLRANGQAG